MRKRLDVLTPQSRMTSPLRMVRIYSRGNLGRRFTTCALFFLIITAVYVFLPGSNITPANIPDKYHLHVVPEAQVPLGSDDTVDVATARKFAHQEEVRLPKTQLFEEQCQHIPARTIEKLANGEIWIPREPVGFLLTRGEPVDKQNFRFAVGTAFCSIILVPQYPPAWDSKNQYRNPTVQGMGPDGLHLEVRSRDVAIIPQHPHYWGSLAVTKNHGDFPIILSVYNHAFVLNQPGEYQQSGEVEFRHYDWAMEDPINLGDEELNYDMLSETIYTRSPPVLISGKPKSRPTARCYHDGFNDLKGRWYRAKSFRRGGKMAQLNPDAHLEFADHNTTTDEWGWTFAPDECNLEYFTAEDHVSCLRDRTVQALGDSNSRRVFKSIIGGGVAWCQDPEHRVCQCEDHYQDDFLDARLNTINATRFQTVDDRETPTVWGDNSKLYFDYVGGLLNKKLFNPWEYFYDSSENSSSIVQQRLERHKRIDVVHVSLLGWDMALVRTTQEVLAQLDDFRKRLFSAYPAGTRFVTRLANSNCCGNINHRTRYSGPRFAIWNEMWRKYWEKDEMNDLMRVIDVTALQGRYDAETKFFCPTTHLRNSHVRIEQMMWMTAVCEKGNGTEATMRTWQGRYVEDT